MIAQLRGKLAHKSTDHVIVDVGGVGYHVHLSLTSHDQLPKEGEEVLLHIHTHVREDQLTLFGFATSSEKSIFQKLISVSGVGPKLAMTLLSGLAPNDVVEAVVKEDLSRLNAIPGIGRKTADRIIVDLKDRFLKEFGSNAAAATSCPAKPAYNDAVSALINLGYQRNIIERTLSKIKMDSETTVQVIVRQVLKELGKA